MKQRRILTIACATLALCSALSLTSCGGGKTYNKLALSSQVIEYAQVFKARGYNSVPHTKQVEVTQDEEGNEVWSTYNEVTDIRLLVVPVEFTDYSADDLPAGRDGTLEAINTIMFGEAEDTEWQSLRSYYYSSSFGQCNISGSVAPWYQTGKTVKDFAASSTSAVFSLGQDLWRYYTSTDGKLELGQMLGYEEGEEGTLADFDANGDYYVDAVVLLYSCPDRVQDRFNNYIDNDLYWAWTSSGLGPSGTTKNSSFDRFFWTSIYTFYEGGTYQDGTWREWTAEEEANGTAKLDAHTLIHEFGHILTLPDYYSYDANSGGDDYYPMGGVDMMDFNIGDHNSVSKAWYGWTSPYIIDHPGTITLGSATTTGDFCIIPIGGEFNGTLCSQYIAIELISPDGVAEHDAYYRLHSSGMSSYPYYYSDVAVRVIHVDARPGLFRYDSSTGITSFAGFRETNINTSSSYEYVDFACDNTASRSCYTNYKLLEVLPSSGRSIKAYGTATNDILWHEGDQFGYGDVYKNYMMNGTDGSKDVKLGYRFTIDEIDEVNKTVTITFKKA